jgi:hypothetical protein
MFLESWRIVFGNGGRAVREHEAVSCVFGIHQGDRHLSSIKDL